MTRSKFAIAAAAIALAALGTQASAQGKGKANNAAPVACSLSDFAGAEACSGFFAGNLLSGSDTNIEAQIAGLAAVGYTFDGVWSSVEGTKVSPLADGFTYDFASLLNGTTFIGIHRGGGGNGSQSTAFYRLNADNLDQISFNLNGGSSAVLYFTNAGAVPEPATWALLMLGFSGVGFSMRRSKLATKEVRVRYA